MTLAVGDIGYDSSGTVLSPQEIIAKGGKFEARYFSGSPGGWKDWSTDELTATIDSGLLPFAYWETTATRMLQGFTAGVVDARVALGETSVGLPPTSPIVFADDENDDTTTEIKVGYADGVASVLDGVWPWGVYGSGELIEAVAAQHPDTKNVHVSSWGETSHAGVRQEANFHSLPGSDNLTLLDPAFFGASAPAPAAAHHLEDRTVLIHEDAGNSNYVLDRSAPVILVGDPPDELFIEAKGGVPVVHVENEERLVEFVLTAMKQNGQTPSVAAAQAVIAKAKALGSQPYTP